MYSGIGRNIFELARRMADRVEYSFAIDDGHKRNLELVAAFGRENEMPVYVGRHSFEANALDAGNTDLPALLRRDEWDVIECVCFANTATNAGLLEHVGDRPLVYTPHDQPLWTVPMSADAVVGWRGPSTGAGKGGPVLCDSLYERDRLAAHGQ